MKELTIRKKFLLLLAVIYLAGLISCNSRYPNVVFILVDDLGWTDLGCYGSTFYDTPNLDQLATESVLFTNAYAACPVCSPTRAALLTGRHPVRIGITDWIPGMPDSNAPNPLLATPEDLHNLPPDEVTLAEVFKESGYRTFFIGKWHLGETEAAWPLTQGFDVNRGGNHRGSPTFPQGNGYYAPYGNPTLDEGPEGEYLTDRLTNESLALIESAGNDPFFLYLAFYTVHTPIQGCDEYDEYYREKSLALPDSGKMLLRQEHDGMTRVNQNNSKYAAMVRSMDTNVGRVIAKLKETGKYNETIIIFTSDNGGLSTTHNGGPTSVVPLRAGKGWCYEGGIRVPLLMRFPGLSAMGSSCAQPVTSMDYFPTLLEWAGMDLPTGLQIDGQNLVPFLKDPFKMESRTLVWHYPHYHGSTWRPGSAIRNDQWKLIEFYESQDIELYNLDEDPGETTDQAMIYPHKVQSLRQEMHQKLNEMGASYPVRKNLP